MASHKPNTKRLTERVAAPFAGAKVDREAGVIRDVVLCGFESANGRDYPAAVFKRDLAKYEGRPVNFNHARESTVDRRGGWVENVRLGADGRPRGDVHLLKEHPYYGRVMEAAERNPRLFGMSHVAMCRTSTKGGREKVESIDHVESIDIVADPATTKSLFEGVAVQIKLSELIESVIPRLAPERAKPVRRFLVLAEDDAGMAPMLDAPVDAPAEGADPDQAIDDAFKQAMHAQVDALLGESHTLADFLSKCRELYKSRQKIMGKPEPKDGSTEGGSGGGSEEGKKPIDYPGLLRECRQAGHAPTDLDLAALAGLTKEQRAEYLADRVKTAKATESKGAEPPISPPRASAAAARKESKTATARVTWD